MTELTEREAVSPPLGSRFYVWGRHCTVVEHGERDGYPAVRLLRDGDTKPEPHMALTRAVLRLGVEEE